MPLISIIIPTAAGETAWKVLLPDLDPILPFSEILILSTEDSPKETPATVTWIKTEAGRAKQLNQGAKQAKGDYLWFVHADTRITRDSIHGLLKILKRGSASLLYFDLKFLKDATPLMKLNEWGVRLRCLFFATPFGDQGLCMNRKQFHELKGYPENVAYGEDHVFVWRAKQRFIPVTRIPYPIYTSARKYKKKGWFKTTLLHQFLWIKQAIPEWRKMT